MKNINKILSVILTLALLAGSLVMAIPASAAETGPSYDAWSNAYEVPNVVMGGDTNVFSIAADGTTMFLWSPLKTAVAKEAASGQKVVTVSNTDGFPKTGFITINATSLEYTAKTLDTFTLKNNAPATYAVKVEVTMPAMGGLFLSTDAGKTWSGANLTAPAAAAITMLKVCPTDTQQLVATDNTNVYRSVNGGKDWFTTISPAVGAIVAIDIVKNNDGTQILAAGPGGVAKLDANVGGWAALPAITGVYTAAFSPDYINDEQVMAVAVVGGNTVLTSNFKGDTTWGATTTPATLKNDNTDNITAITSACLAFPSDYYWGSTNQVFVGITDAGIAGDVYRVNGALSGNTPTVKDLGVDADVISLAVSGTKADSTVIASLTGAGITLSTNADTASAPDWSTDGIKKPFGTGAVLALASTGILYAGDNSAHSSFYQATADFKSFNGISRTEVTNIYDFGYSRGVVKDGTATGVLYFSYYFKLVGTNWEMRYFAGDTTKPGFAQNPASVRGSNVMYAVLNTNTKQIQKTIDGGLNWTTIAAPGNKAITTITVVTDDLYYIGYTGKIRSNTGAELDLAGVNQDPSTIAMVGTTGILVGTNGRTPSTWLYSKDSGATFKILGTQDKFTGAKAQKYIVSQNTIYVVDSTNNLWTYNLDTDTEWQKEKALTGVILPSGKNISAVNVVSDIIFIVVKNSTAGYAQIFRSLPGEDGTFDFRPYPKTDAATLNGEVDGLNVFDNGDGTFNVKPTIVAPFATTFTYPAVGIAGLELVYTDTTAGQLVTTSPVMDAQVNNPVDLSWKAPKTTGTVYFKYEVARDADFKQIVSQDDETTTTTVFGVIGDNGKDLPTGIKYYWRVCIDSTANTDLNGLWSETQSFIIKTIGNVNTEGIGRPESVYPAQGATGASTTPVLTWGVVAGATYNVKIATDSAFTNVIDSKDGLTVAVYTPAKALTPNTVYFWEVQAVAGGIASDWVAFAFTTASDATPTGTVTPPVTTIINPTPVVTVTIPPAAPPATPAYIWFIIVIGAVLVIAVIVLIVRTRRV